MKNTNTKKTNTVAAEQAEQQQAAEQAAAVTEQQAEQAAAENAAEQAAEQQQAAEQAEPQSDDYTAAVIAALKYGSDKLEKVPAPTVAEQRLFNAAGYSGSTAAEFFHFAESVNYGITINKSVMMAAGVTTAEYNVLMDDLDILKTLSIAALDATAAEQQLSHEAAMLTITAGKATAGKQTISRKAAAAAAEKAQAAAVEAKMVINEWYAVYKHIRQQLYFSGCCERDAFNLIAGKVVNAKYANRSNIALGYIYAPAGNMSVLQHIFKIHSAAQADYLAKCKERTATQAAKNIKKRNK